MEPVEGGLARQRDVEILGQVAELFSDEHVVEDLELAAAIVPAQVEVDDTEMRGDRFGPGISVG